MKEELKEYIKVEILNDADFNLENSDDLLNSGLIDSMGIMRLVAFINDKFDIVVPPEDLIIEHFETLEAIEIYLTSVKS